jgi:SAM-dependent methyltransferase
MIKFAQILRRSSTELLTGSVTFRSYEEWTHWSAHNDQVELSRRVADEIRRRGFRDPFGKRAPRPKIAVDEDLREKLFFLGINSRMRAVLLSLLQHGARSEDRIFGAEALSPLAQRLREHFRSYVGSEYAPTAEARRAIFPHPHKDLMELDLPDADFSYATTNDVLEHVPDIDRALTGLARILKPGGWHVGTVPFRWGSDDGLVRAKRVGDTVVHLTEPEYHHNPISPEGSLVFELPGWDILDRARTAGFSDATMEYRWSAEHGVVAAPLGVFVLALQR